MIDPSPLIAAEHGIKQTKQGHRVLFCCDSRKAVLLFSLLSLLLNAFGILTITLFGVPFTVIQCVMNSLTIAFCLLVLFGAITYHRCAVILAVIWELVAIALSISLAVLFDWASVSGPDQHSDKVGIILTVTILLAWRLLVVYLYFSFAREVSSGIMNSATYDREKYSCCCNV